MNRMSMNLVPLANVESAGLAGGWRSLNDDPQFVVSAEAGDVRLAAGWYRLTVELARVDGRVQNPCLYPDYGTGASEVERIALPDPEGGSLSAIVCFKRDVVSLRFDPSVSRCSFKLGKFVIERISKRRAAVGMVDRIAGSSEGPTRGPSRLRVFAETLRRAGGAGRFGHELRSRYIETFAPIATNYKAWVERYDNKKDFPFTESELERLSHKPLFSIIVPVYNTPERWLVKCIESVRKQIYPHWELCLSDDASTLPHVRAVIEQFARLDPRIKPVFRPVNGHISESSNSAIQVASGDWLVLVDHDDEIPPDALAELALAINANPKWKLIYSDEDKIDDIGRRFDPYFKPDWNYELFLSHNCISHLGAYRADLVRTVGGFRKGLEGSQDWDLALRCIETLGNDEIGHVPKILYHWRAIPGSTALGPGEKSYAHFAAMRAIQDHLDRIAANATVLEIPNHPGNYRVRYSLPSTPPSVELIIPTRDRLELLRTCVESVLEKTRYANFSLTVVDNQSRDESTLRYLKSIADRPDVKVLVYDAPFNYAAINNFAVASSSADFVCLLNNDIEVVESDWLEEMVSHARKPAAGAVGAKLYFPNGTLQHAGVILGFNGVGVHAYSGRPREWYGQALRARLIQSMSAVTAACLVVSRDKYLEVGGMDEELKVAYNDVDFCLKLRKAGYRNIWTPYAELVHHESATRGAEDSPEKLKRFWGEVEIMQKRWGSVIARDPAYNPNLAITGETFDYAFPPR